MVVEPSLTEHRVDVTITLIGHDDCDARTRVRVADPLTDKTCSTAGWSDE
jgi:hypothetical protein